MRIEDLAIVGTLVLLEALLSVDNALVLALIAKRLPDKAAQSKALTVGVGLSFGLRVVGLLLASFVIKFWSLRAAGALYLLFLCVSHFVHHARHGRPASATESSPTHRQTFGKIVLALALTDAAFAVDSILVAVALTEKLWVIYLGVALGILALRFVAGAFLKILERYPALDHAAYVLVGWAGLRLGMEALEAFGAAVLGAHWAVTMPDWLFWVGMGLTVVCGGLYARRHPVAVRVVLKKVNNDSHQLVPPSGR